MFGYTPRVECNDVLEKGALVKKYVLTLTDFNWGREELVFYFVGTELRRYEDSDVVALLFSLSEYYGKVTIDLGFAPVWVYAEGCPPDMVDTAQETGVVLTENMEGIFSGSRPFGAELSLIDKPKVYLALCYDIIIIPELRGKGLVSFLLSELIELMKKEAKEKGLDPAHVGVVPLKVYSHDPQDEHDPENKARRERLYKKLGFELTGQSGIAPSLAHLHGCYSRKLVRVSEIGLSDDLVSAIRNHVAGCVRDWLDIRDRQKFHIAERVREAVVDATSRPAYMMEMALAGFTGKVLSALGALMFPLIILLKIEEKIVQMWKKKGEKAKI